MRQYGFSAFLVFLLFCATPDEAESQSFTAVVTGAQEVPQVQTRARSLALFRFLLNDRLLVAYRLNFAHQNVVTGVHVHEGPIGEDGPIILNLRPDGFCLDITPFFTIYFATADQLRDRLAGGTLSDLRAAMQTGNTYINLHTDANPGGEIRGQFPPPQ